MSVAFDAATGTTMYVVDSASWSHTCTGADRALYVGVTYNLNHDPSGVTYNGVALTLRVDRADYYGTRLWSLAAPASGSNTVTVTGGSMTGTTSSASYTGVATPEVEQTASNANVNVTSMTATLTTITDNAWVVGFVSSSNGGGAPTYTAGTDTTIRNQLGETPYNSGGAFIDRNQATHPVGSETLGASVTPGTPFMTVMLVSIPAAIAPLTAFRGFTQQSGRDVCWPIPSGFDPGS